jgi:hypothetical protein
MHSNEKLYSRRKALTLNLDPSTFGSFAKIGAGQEVARWFLVVGGASGTVGKTISAHDKEVSDDLYGSGSRYVSKQRLETEDKAVKNSLCTPGSVGQDKNHSNYRTENQFGWLG